MTTQVYQIYIRTSAQAIWDAITQPEWSAKYGYGGYVDYDLKPGGHYRVRPDEAFRAGALERGNDLPEVIIEGEVLEADPPRKLVTTFRMLMDPQMAAQPVTTVTHEITEMPNGTCRLVLTHDLTGADMLAQLLSGAWADQGAGGGHAWVLSDLKTLLETGKGFNQ